MGWPLKSKAKFTGLPDNPPNEGGAGQKPREIRFLGDLQRLEVKPGDRFVLTMPGPVSAEAHEHIQRLWKGFIGGDTEALHKLLVLEPGMKLGAIGSSED